MEREKERLRIVIDTNILIGALVRDTSFKASLLKNKKFRFFFPDYGLTGIEKFREYICLKTRKNTTAHRLITP